MRLLNPRLDIVFKLLLLRNRDLLQAQLEAILGRPVIHVEVLNPEIPGDLAGDKSIVLDLRVRVDGNERLDVEMQAQLHGFLANRVLYYAARDYGGQLQRGNDYGSLTPTVSVLWVNARMFPTMPRFHLRFELLETLEHERFSDQLAVHVLQLPEIATASSPPAAPSERALYNWGRFFAAPDETALAELVREDKTMAAALEALERLSADPEAQRLAREREDALRLYELSLADSRREGHAEGHAEGREEGRAETLKETILVLAASIDLELTPEQRARLDDPRTNLVELRDALIRERRWP